jgi:cysteine desulfurase
MQAYLDNNATTMPAPEVVAAMNEMLTSEWANPSSVHRFGQRARHRVELAREQAAKLLGCSPRELVFTSGATESNNTALRGLLEAQPAKRTIITTKLEHSAVREPAKKLAERGYNVIWLPVDIHGVVDLNALEAALTEHGQDVAIVAIHWINNETGTIQDIVTIGELCRRFRVPCFTDATQAIGKVPCDLSKLPVDLLSFAGHKFHGPKGVGGLFVRRGVKFVPQQLGGPHERERRGGTENTPGIVGLGVACELATQFLAGDGAQRGQRQRDRLEQAILRGVPDAVVNSAGAKRLWNTTNLGFPTLESEAILVLLSERGICAAAGAACSSGSLEPSPVLLAQGIPEPIAHGSIRLSLSRYTTDAEIDYAIATVPEVIARLKGSMPAVS